MTTADDTDKGQPPSSGQPHFNRETHYNGETKHRSKWVAIALTYLCPGLGYMYVGQFIKGLTVNLLFLLMLEIFIISLSILKFFPIIPFLVLVIAWIVFSTLIALEVGKQAEDKGDGYVLQGYNHWTIYIVAFLLTFLVPIVLTVDFTRSNLWQLETVENGAMYPTVQPGETVLVDMNAFRQKAPVRGDVVAVTPPEADDMQMLRIVGVHQDIVRMEGNTLYVNDEAVGRSPLDEAQVADGDLANAELEKESGLLAWVEHNQGERYVISVSPRVYTELTMPPTRLESDQFFLLADNRSQVPVQGENAPIRDSRNFGNVPGKKLEGVPRFIFWSVGPDGSIRWDRIGLRVR